MSDEHERLVDVLAEFAATMVTDSSVQGILDYLVTRIVDVLPITAAGAILLWLSGEPRYVAASDPEALRLELHTGGSDGPGLPAQRSGGPVPAGLAVVLAVSLRHGDQMLGVLRLYRNPPAPLNAAATRTAQTLADVAAAYLRNANTRQDRETASDLAHHIYLHDPLTGLPNRALLLERLTQAFHRSRRSNAVAAVLYVDLDGFKAVNDRLGHAAGDALLVALARRLCVLLRPADTLARLHGDEFVVLCQDLHHPGEAQLIARRLELAVTEPFDLPGGRVAITASVGVAFADPSIHAPDEVLSNADTAMYQAKRARRAVH